MAAQPANCENEMQEKGAYHLPLLNDGEEGFWLLDKLEFYVFRYLHNAVMVEMMDATLVKKIVEPIAAV